MKIRIDSILASLASCLLFVGCQEVEEPANTIPTVNTDAIKEIGMNNAVVWGSVTSESYCKFLLSTQPDLSDAKVFDAYRHSGGTGVYQGELTGLTPGTTYYVALKASDGYSEIVGNVETFKTLSRLGIESVTLADWDGKQSSLFTESPVGTFVYSVSEEKLHLDFYNKRTTYANGKWSFPSSNDIGFNGQSKRLYAYYPYKEQQYEATKVRVLANKVDVLYGQSQDLSESDPNATIALKHAMSKVTFAIKKASGSESFDVTIGSIRLRNTEKDKVDAVRYDGYLNLLTGEITTGDVGFGHDGIGVDCNLSLSADKSQGVDFYVIPNSFLERQAMLVLFEKNGSNSYVLYFGDTTWKAGQHYTYTVTVTPVGLQLGDVRVEEWENNEGGTIIIN